LKGIIMDIGNITFAAPSKNNYDYVLTDSNFFTTNVISSIDTTVKTVKVNVKLWNKGSQPLPEYAKDGDAGMDIRANENVKIYPGETKLVKTGIHISLPPGFEIQVRPRSGQSLKTKIRVANSPGTIDQNYTGEICIICDNIGQDPYEIKEGDRIAQIVLNEVPMIKWEPVNNQEDLGKTNRGTDGFGSTGHN
jgi:dUTP pyrophosphatase